jgi:hypothetical protein
LICSLIPHVIDHHQLVSYKFYGGRKCLGSLKIHHARVFHYSF